MRLFPCWYPRTLACLENRALYSHERDDFRGILVYLCAGVPRIVRVWCRPSWAQRQALRGPVLLAAGRARPFFARDVLRRVVWRLW